jgi:site-specific DNA recombinase
LNKIEEQINKNNQRFQNAQSLLLDAEINAGDYKEIKIKITATNDDPLRKKANVSAGKENFQEHLQTGVTLLRDIDAFYQNATLAEKQLIIGSVFPEKLIFEKKSISNQKDKRSNAFDMPDRQ